MKSGQITIHDIARMLNISASTVSRALSGNPRISKSTRDKVKKLAGKLNYQPNIVATNLRTGKSKTIGIVVPHINRNFFSNVIGGIEQTASNAGYRVIITQTYELYEKEVENIMALMNARVDGILVSVSGGTKTFAHFELVKKRGMPLLFFDRTIDEIETSRVMIDDFMGAYKAVRHLIEEGFKKIAHFAGPRHINIYKKRWMGYQEALKEGGLKSTDELLFIDNLTEEKGWKAAAKLMKLKNRPDAIFSASDISALGAIKYLKEHGYRIPEDMAIVGFANEPFTSIMEPGLTSVEQKGYLIGVSVANLFFEEIQHQGETRPFKKIIIEPELIIRKSSLKKSG
ncbi:MAG TPA: LacI family DNA-binding transcriptional regulator [Bacteroidales bacterium]|nr:LacI family DNA-binding transcriptional regulator [Bacteroidales bacterium]